MKFFVSLVLILIISVSFSYSQNTKQENLLKPVSHKPVVQDDSTQPKPLADIEITVVPNPFPDHTTIKVTLNNGKKIENGSLTVWDTQGNKVKELFNGSLLTTSTFEWYATDEAGTKVAGGAYIYQLLDGGKVYSGNLAFNK